MQDFFVDEAGSTEDMIIALQHAELIRGTQKFYDKGVDTTLCTLATAAQPKTLLNSILQLSTREWVKRMKVLISYRHSDA